MDRSSGTWRWVPKVRAWIRARRREGLRLLDARISIVPIALGILLLSQPQGRDVVRDLVDSSNLYLHDPHGVAHIFSTPALWSYFRWHCFVVACVWSGVIAWYWPHLLTRSRTAAKEPYWFTLLRRGLGLMPTTAAIVTILITGGGHRDDVWLALVIFALVWGILLYFFKRRIAVAARYFGDSWFNRPSRIMEPMLARFGGRQDVRLTLGDDAFVLSTFWLSFLVLVLFSMPVIRTEFATHVGSASIAFGAAGSMIATVSAVIWILSGVRMPVISLGVIAILVFSMTNDNHKVTAVPSDLLPRRTDIDHAYHSWELSNPDGPIILVATAGGASRAGYWTATVLRALDDRTDGQFASHVFAISSVSGGTLGAVGYAAWVADHPATDPRCRYSPAARLAFDRDFMGRDYLAPTIGGLLYPDLVQQFLPFPAFADRASSLEESLERGWSGAVARQIGCGRRSPQRFAGDYLDIWRTSLDRTGPWVPIVFANGTLVEDGKRVITAPIVADAAVFEDSHDFLSLFGHSVSTSTAVLNSARFPLISPAASVPYTDTVRPHKKGVLHVVDGGYFDNGGVETVYDIARYLRATIGAKRSILIIEINNDDAAPDDPHSVEDLARYPNGMDPAGTARVSLGVAPPKLRTGAPATGLRSILEAFYKTRTSRGVLGAKRLSATKSIGLIDTYRATFNLGPLLAGRRTAMSWSLSLSSRQAMDDALQFTGLKMDSLERDRVQSVQKKLDWTLACERMVADEIAVALGARVTPAPGNCHLNARGAQWVGLPLGLPPAGPGPKLP